jgi:two-component sensor histidine kinase
MLGKTDFDYFSKEFAQKSYADDESVFRSGEPIINKEELVDTVRGKRWVLVTKLPLRDEEGTIIGTMGLSRDITPIKEAEQRIQEEVKEKDFLMQEIHHRIKNNLAMISSLIHLKASQFADEHELQDLEYQIETIRLVHEKLYQTDTIKNVDFSSYIQDLLTTIFSSFSGSPVKIENRITGISLDSKTAIYLGLIINEIATNAMKYSFDSNTENRFTLEMEEREDAPPEEEDRVSHPSPSAPVYVLTIKNSGEPIPKDVDLQNSSTLGMHLISALVEQLEGTITIEKEPSPQYIITIPA